MYLQIASDLHLEHQDNPVARWRDYLYPCAPYLALLGDTAPLCRTDLWRAFLTAIAPYWKRIFIIYGNHEFYSWATQDEAKTNTITALKDSHCELLHNLNLPHITLLDQTVVELADEGICLVGTTLWSQITTPWIDYIKRSMSDYKAIWVEGDQSPRKLRTVDTNQFHQDSVRFLTEALQQAQTRGRRVVVLTHHAPLLEQTSDPKHATNDIHEAFASDLSALFSPNIIVWAFGHTHWHTDFIFQNTRVVSNPYGYNGLEPCRETYRRHMVLSLK